MNIIFMGTPDFAVPALRALINSDEHNIKAVFTKAPKPKNRGMEVTLSPVHELALEYNLPVHTPKTLRNDESVQLIESIDADVIVVVAYGLIIPANILEIKKYGCINIHPSSLPKYRGAAPLQRTIINDERETSICLIQMDEGIDTGDILIKKDIKIDQDTTLLMLHDQCAQIGGELLLELLRDIDNVKPVKQLDAGVSYADKLAKSEGEVKWGEESAAQVHAKVRGMNPWPGAYFYLGSDRTMIKILRTQLLSEEKDAVPGQVLGPKFDVSCTEGVVRLLEVQPEGKKKMSGEDFLRGRAVEVV